MLRIITRQLQRVSNIRERIKQQRQSRLHKSNVDNVLPTKTAQKLQKIRNIGIIAHIDAGKTTTTQRMLYYAGALPSPGCIYLSYTEIDEGTTTMDYMKQQRERGITIRSAAISFNWNSYQINLIDTPGHVDFSGEVTRSLRVLDGAVTIIDGVKGVEAQTTKVWQHASKRGIPKLCYINKMDRIGSSVIRTAQMLQGIMKVDPLIMQAAIGQSDNFIGVVDLINLEQILFSGKYGENVEIKPIVKTNVHYRDYLLKRSVLVEKIANYDDKIGEMYLNQMEIGAEELKRGLRRILNDPKYQSKICLIFLGSSYRNRGVQPLMNAIIDYLPSPTEREPIQCINDPTKIRKPLKSQPLAAYTFKVIYDLDKGPLAYTRIYSGQLKKTTSLFNTDKSLSEKSMFYSYLVGHIYRVRANQYVQINEVEAGDIVAISGLQSTRAGDTLVTMGEYKFVMEKLDLPAPVFTMPFQLQNSRDEPAFLAAIARATTQDNSLQFTHESQTGQYLLSGLGELHLQILRDKLVQDRIKIKIGDLKINYQQSITESCKQKLHLKHELKNNHVQQIELEIALVPLRNNKQQVINMVNVVFTFEKVPQFDANWNQYVKRKSMLQKKDPKQMKDDEVQMPLQQLKSSARRAIRNPTPVEPIQQKLTEEEEDELDMQMLRENDLLTLDEQQKQQKQQKGKQNKNTIVEEQQQEEDEQEEEGDEQQDEANEAQNLYHINTLPFETLYELMQSCKMSILSGKKGYPCIGLQLQISYGSYRRSRFSRSIMNKCCNQLVKSLLNKHSLLFEPVMEYSLEGETSMINIVVKDILKKRGRIDEQEDNKVTGLVPAASVKGWVKELRSMGLDISLKFSHYEQMVGMDPDKAVAENM